jgi:hypothetical protein
MRAEEARKLADSFTPEIRLIIKEIERRAERGEYTLTSSDIEMERLLGDAKVRAYLEKLGYKVTWRDVQRDGYWEIKW